MSLCLSLSLSLSLFVRLRRAAVADRPPHHHCFTRPSVRPPRYYYRYPRGESYRDLVLRIEPLLLEIEREEDLLIVSHQAVARCLLAYFKNIPQNDLSKELPYLEVPLHTVLKVVPGIFECQIDRFHLGPDAVNTQQSRPESIEPREDPPADLLSPPREQGIPEEKGTAD